jgi:GTP cyclohydrolase II
MPLQAPINADNRRYLAAKAARAGHQLDHLIAALGGSSPERAPGPALATAEIAGAGAKPQI